MFRSAHRMHRFAETRLQIEITRVAVQVLNKLLSGYVPRIFAIIISEWQRREAFYGVEVQTFVMSMPRRTNLALLFKNDEFDLPLPQTRAYGQASRTRADNNDLGFFRQSILRSIYT
jgi:hypothetical protein